MYKGINIYMESVDLNDLQDVTYHLDKFEMQGWDFIDEYKNAYQVLLKACDELVNKEIEFFASLEPNRPQFSIEAIPF